MADVHDEIAASFEVLDEISKSSRLDRRETEDFIADLGRAVFAEPAEFGRSSGEVVAANTAATPKPQPTTPRPKPPVTQTVATAPPTPRPKPKPPAGGGGDEVFNP